jgi:hypothetical protein
MPESAPGRSAVASLNGPMSSDAPPQAGSREAASDAILPCLP